MKRSRASNVRDSMAFFTADWEEVPMDTMRMTRWSLIISHQQRAARATTHSLDVHHAINLFHCFEPTTVPLVPFLSTTLATTFLSQAACARFLQAITAGRLTAVVTILGQLVLQRLQHLFPIRQQFVE